MVSDNKTWEYSEPQLFWRKIAPGAHVVQFYEDNENFLMLLEDFIVDGINAGDGVLVIATAEHLLNLYNKLTTRGFDVDFLRNDDQYIQVNTDHALAEFMVEKWPDERLFRNTVNGLFKRAQKETRNVRVFGEMVATLWAQGDSKATVHLEHLWDNYCKANNFSLFCAYPKNHFTESSDITMKNICGKHSLMLKEVNSKSRISYKKVD